MPGKKQSIRDRWAESVHRTGRAMDECMKNGEMDRPTGLASEMLPLILQTRGVLEDAMAYQTKLNERAAARRARKAAEQKARERHERDDADPAPEPPQTTPDKPELPPLETTEPPECRQDPEAGPLPPEPEAMPDPEPPPRRPVCFTFTGRP